VAATAAHAPQGTEREAASRDRDRSTRAGRDLPRARGSQEPAPDPHPEVGRREEALVAPGLAEDAGLAQECLFQLWQCLLSWVFGIKSHHYRTDWLRTYHFLEAPVN
jgi:hypothetical protein